MLFGGGYVLLAFLRTDLVERLHWLTEKQLIDSVAVLDGVDVASLALMVAVTWELGRTALIDVPTLVLAVASAVLLLRFKVGSTWLVAGAACIGVIMKLFA